MMSKNFEKVKRYYEESLWNLEMVKKAVGKWITKEEYKEITGNNFEEEVEKE